MGQKKSHNLSRQTKKSRNLVGHKKIMQPLGTNKRMQPFKKNNHATYRDKTKKLWHLSGQKITQPLRTKKSRNLPGQKKIMQHLGTIFLATSQNKKNT